MDNNDNLPADPILQRIHALEEALRRYQQQSQPDLFITPRPTLVDLRPYPDFYTILPETRNYFFRSPLPETERRTFLHSCPSNLDRQYRPPPLQIHNVGTFTKLFDQQLSDIQYRLSGITRPLDLMGHNLAQGQLASFYDGADFLRTTHSLLSDVAFHITQTRMDNVCRDTCLASVPIRPEPHHEPLLDTCGDLT